MVVLVDVRGNAGLIPNKPSGDRFYPTCIAQGASSLSTQSYRIQLDPRFIDSLDPVWQSRNWPGRKQLGSGSDAWHRRSQDKIVIWHQLIAKKLQLMELKS